MKVDTKKEKPEIIIDPEDRDIISAADEKLNKLTPAEKELVESIIEKNLNYSDITNPNPQLPTSIGKALENLLSPQAATVLLSIIINPQHIDITLNELKAEELISENTSNFILELTAKYGEAMHTLMLNIERPHDWIRLKSDVLIADNILKLNSKMWRADGEVFQFTSSLQDIFTLVDHFMRRTLETIETIDKERVLELDETMINKLEKHVVELKELHESVKREIEIIERK